MVNSRSIHKSFMKIPALTDPNRLLLFTIYAFLIGLLATLTPEAMKGLFSTSESSERWYPGAAWLGTLAVVVILFVVYHPKIKVWFQANRALAPLTLTSHYNVRSVKGLVLLVSRGEVINMGNYAIDYHCPTLTHVWLIHSSDPGSKEGVQKITQHCGKVAPALVVEPVPLSNVLSVEMAKALVESIRKEANGLGIEDPDFICDFTGMPKPVSAGVVLACIRPGHRLQYMEPQAVVKGGGPLQTAGSRP